MKRRHYYNRPLYPPTVFRSENAGDELKEVPYDLYLDAMRRKKVGDILCHEIAAPGSGRNYYVITRMDRTGVYARRVSYEYVQAKRDRDNASFADKLMRDPLNLFKR